MPEATLLDIIGTAFHPGDTVILRLRREWSDSAMVRMHDVLVAATKRTGVHFVILTSDVEVVLADREEA